MMKFISKIIRIDSVGSDRASIGAFIAYENHYKLDGSRLLEFYLLVSLVKWQVSIGKLI